MQTFIFAGDESGDVSFNFPKGASRYFVMTVIGTDEPEALRQVLADLRVSNGLPVHYEFSFHALSSAALRQRVFAALAQAKFEAWAVVADKTTLPDIVRLLRPEDLYLYFVTEAIQLIPAAQREGATLVLDEFSAASDISTALRRFLKTRNIPRHFKRVLVKRSQSEPLIQVADLVAGAILRRDTHNDVEAYEWVEKKIRQLQEFRL